MKKLSAKLTTLGLLLLASSAYGDGPGFDGVDVLSGTTGTLNGCPVDATNCNILITGEGFLQQEVVFSQETFVQTVIIDPFAGFDQFKNPPYNFKTSLTYPLVNTVTSTGKVTVIDPSILNIPTDESTEEAANVQSTDQPASFGAFETGTHFLTWQGPQQDESTEAPLWTHILHVLPLASFGPATVIPASEGSRVTIPVYLNGDAPSYPVRIPYTISGSATSIDDHNAIDGEVSFGPWVNKKMSTISFTVADDEIDNEGIEDIIITLQSPTTENAALSTQTIQRVVITEGHVPPQLDLTVKQDDVDTRLITNNAAIDESVIATVKIRANNPIHRYQLDWSESDSLLLSAATYINGAHLKFDPTLIPPGIYTIKVQITDLIDPARTTYTLDTLINVADVNIEVITDTAAPDVAIQHSHTFDNGFSIHWPALVSDRWENFPPRPFISNTITILPFSDIIFSDISFIDLTPYESIVTLVSPPDVVIHDTPFAADVPHVADGLSVRSGGIIVAAGKTGIHITIDDINTHGGPNGGPALYPVDDDHIPTQIVDFEVAGLTTPGQSISIVIPQENPIPENPVYRKYMPHSGWVSFTENGNNSLASTSKANGICPGPEDAAYVAGLTVGHDCIRLTIEDGGPNDADQQANSIIKDPGGVTSAPITATGVDSSPTTSAETSNSSENGGGGGSGLSLLWLLFTLSAARICYRTNRKQ